jgi:hypothetical protein
MKCGVIISSAINSAVGNSVYTSEQRFEQTLKTISSIKEHMSDVTIVMADSSIPGVDEEIKNKLTAAGIDYFLDFSKDTILSQLKDLPHKDTVQNLSELVVLNKAFKIIKDNGWFDNCDRVFKMSARYWLNEKFDISRYEQEDTRGKYVLTKRMLSQFPREYVGQSLQHMLRVYSFDGSLLDDFIDKLKIMTQHMQAQINEGKYIDVEHLFCKFIPRNMICEIARSGVTGNISKNGALIEN